MNTKTFFFLLSFCFFLLFSAFVYGQNPNCFRVTFSDKNNSPYSVTHPEDFLSSRAIAKRERFNIPVVVEDLPVNPQYITAIQNIINEPTSIIAISKWNNSVVLFCPETTNWQSIVNKLVDSLPFVKDVLPVANYPKSKNFEIPVYEQISDAIVYNSSCDYNYGNSIGNIYLHKGDLLHKAGYCGENMLICVFDAGWENFNNLPSFKSLYDNGQIWGTRDLIPGINNVYIGHSHGTAVTSEMASASEGSMVGTAPKANYYFIRSENPWSEQLVEEDFWAQAAEIADSLGADVSTASLGYTTFDTLYKWQNIYTQNNNDGKSSIASRAASLLAQKGVIVVNSAGNEGNNSWKFLGRPADAFNILAVGAVNGTGAVASFSSYGPSADGRIKPDIASVGWDAWIFVSEGFLTQGSGTSMAAPIIAGLSACLWQALPQYSSLELMQLIREYGNRYNNPDNRTGYGIPNYYQLYLDHTNSIQDNKFPSLSVYPNPTAGELRIMREELRVTSIEIYDVYGRKVGEKFPSNSLDGWQPEVEGAIIDISHLAQGIYFLKIDTDAGEVIKKVVKKA